MPVIAVINRKGGSGKSTLATHLAAYCANKGVPVMLGNVDRQQSTQAWLRLRDTQRLPQCAPIVGWAVDPRNVLRPPAGLAHVILDTPGGLRGMDLARVVMYADAILMPVCNSVFDRESAAECYAELLTLPRVTGGRCKVAAIGMRLDGRTKAAEVLQEWAGRQKLPFIGVLRETQAYVRCVEQGLSLFDLPAAQVQADMAQWNAILEWLEPVFNPVHKPEPAIRRPVKAPTVARDANAGGSKPTQAPTFDRAAARPGSPAQQDLREPATRSRVAGRIGRLFGWLPMLRFLQRDS